MPFEEIVYTWTRQVYLRFTKLTLDTIMTAIAVVGIALFILMSGGCAPKQARVKPATILLEDTASYKIWRLNDTEFLIRAVTLVDAEHVAMNRLSCQKHVCVIGPDSVIMYVKRPDYPGHK